MSTIWTGDFSIGVHQTSEAGSASITSARGLSTCLPGRSAYLGGFTRDGEFPTGHISVAPSGMDPKLSKVGTPTYSGFRVHHSCTQEFTVAPLPKMRIKVQVIDHWHWATTVSALDMHRMPGTIQYIGPLSAQRVVAFPAYSVVDPYCMGPNLRGLGPTYTHPR